MKISRLQRVGRSDSILSNCEMVFFGSFEMLKVKLPSRHGNLFNRGEVYNKETATIIRTCTYFKSVATRNNSILC